MKIAVLDVGKTNVKVMVVDGVKGREIASRVQANPVVREPPYPHFDVDKIFAFFLASLKDLYVSPGFDAISITAHGACCALLDDEGLALPILDYEFNYPEQINVAYEAVRPPFSRTFSPRLSGGLNLGAQLHYLKTVFPEAFARAKKILTYPQYWAWRLTGIAASEATSLGCHTDLWLPREGRFSELVDYLDIAERMAPVRKPFDLLGPVKPDIARTIGLPESVPVYCGIHDSNASLLPHLLRQKPPFTVVSTGTWVVLFAVGGNLGCLDSTRDTLANVDAYGRPVPSARFMGGREFELLTGGKGKVTDKALARVLGQPLLFLPSVMPGSGPFPGAKHRIENAFETMDEDDIYVAASLYVALMTKSCLDLLNASGPIVLEGPFVRNHLYGEALHAATGLPIIPIEGSTGTSLGAAMLAGVKPPELPKGSGEFVLPEGDLRHYCRTWLRRIEQR